MLNYRRRKRQADENSNIVISKWDSIINNRVSLYQGKYCIRNDSELMALVKKIVCEVQIKANSIAADWSIPIIIEAIGRMYYGNRKENVQYGTIFKRALVYLWNANTTNVMERKNIESLLEVLGMCYVLEGLYGFRRFFLISNEFSFVVENGYFRCDDEYRPMIAEFADLIQGRGKRMRIAATNSELMLKKAGEFHKALLKVLSGEEPKNIRVFSGTFYEKIPGILDNECKKFWQSIFFRYELYISTLISERKESGNEKDFVPSVTLFHEFEMEFPEGLFTQEIVQDVFWNREWLDGQEDERYGNLIVERPIMRITSGGDFATCSVLIGDSINDFIERQILNYPSKSPKIKLPPIVFKNAISVPFEDKVINSFREINFYAGHVSEKGIWEVQNKSIDLNCKNNIRLYGEIDTLAYSPTLNFAILVECKVLNDVRDYRSYKNIVSKLVDDSEGFHAKVLNKSEWVNKALSNYYKTKVEAVCVILTDIPIPIVDCPNEDIILTYYNNLISSVKELLKEYEM